MSDGTSPDLMAADSAGADPLRFLIVDDSGMMRRMLSSMISAEPGWDVCGTAVNGLDAIAKVGELRPDICLLDLEMPVMGGLQALPYLRSASDTDIIVVSSVAQPGSGERLNCLLHGAAAVVAKPSGAVSTDLTERRGTELKQAIRQLARHRADLRRERV
jgi:two-component system, chemotaxis family, protein-glutamate methylesterase/glutaminase